MVGGSGRVSAVVPARSERRESFMVVS